MLPYTGEITIPAQQTVKKTYAITYPIGFSGLSHGCIAYYKVGADMNNGGMFSVRVRAVRFVDVMVSDTKAIQGLSISKRPTLTKVGDEYVITLGIHNYGNVDEQVAITGRVSNIL